MPKIRRGKEELHVLLRALTDNMDYRGGGVPVARLKYSNARDKKFTNLLTLIFFASD